MGTSSCVQGQFKGLGKVFQTELPSVNPGLLQGSEDGQKSSLLGAMQYFRPLASAMVALTQQPLLITEANSCLWYWEVSPFLLTSGFSSAMEVRYCKSAVGLHLSAAQNSSLLVHLFSRDAGIPGKQQLPLHFRKQ